MIRHTILAHVQRGSFTGPGVIATDMTSASAHGIKKGMGQIHKS